MEIYVVAVLDIGETFNPHSWMLRFLHAQNVYDHHVDDLYLAISLGMERFGLSELCVQHQLETGLKFTKEPAILI